MHRAEPEELHQPGQNTTAVAAMAIVAAGGRFSHSPVTFFQDSQESNGSFGVYGVSGDGQQGDPDSTAYVIQALVALHALSDQQFTRNGSTPEQALARFQYGCKAPVKERGEFSYFGVASQLATLQAVPAAAGVALPVRPGSCPLLSPSSAVLPKSGSAAAVALVAVAVLAAIVSGATRAAGEPGTPKTPAIRSGHLERCSVPPRVDRGQLVVPVVVDFGGPDGKVLVTCVTAHAGETDAQVLQTQALSSATRFPATTNLAYFVPSTVIRPVDAGASPGGHYAYWAYWHGGRTWQYANDGPGETTVSKGDVEGWRFEPEGSASPSDPPPRAPSLASKLERPANSTQPSTSETTSLPSGKSSGGDPAGPVARRQESGTKTGLFVVSLALIVLLGAAAFARSRRTNRHIT